ncbi:MAG: hypothetical protein QXP36_14675 [Conexivisphaerales archaeon]
MREDIKILDSLIRESVLSLHIHRGAGRPGHLNLVQKLKLILIKQLVDDSNRMFTSMLDFFILLSRLKYPIK